MNLSKLTDQFSKIKVKSVADSPFKYGLLILVLAVIASIYSPITIAVYLLFGISGALFFLGICQTIYFTFKNPDYLRSEEFHIKKQSLEILGDDTNMLPADGQNVVDIANPLNIEDAEVIDG